MAMTSERDAYDDQLIREQRFDELLAAYYPIMVARLRMRVPAGMVYDVAHDAVVRLLGELQRGRHYPVPFRVVVHQVTGWTLGDHYVQAKTRLDSPMPPDWIGWEAYTASEDGRLSTMIYDDWLRYLFARLTPHDRDIAAMYFVDDMSIVAIAAALGLARNAIDQALHRIRKTLREEGLQ